MPGIIIEVAPRCGTAGFENTRGLELSTSPTKVLLALYSDDSAFFTSSRKNANAARKLQPQLDLLPEWLDRWWMSVNVK